MKSEKIKDIAELVGIFAIVVSLVFVGLEVRQSAAATRGATQQALSDSAREASAALAADKVSAELTLRFFNSKDWSGFSEDERFRVVLLFTSMLRVYENAHYQWREGNLAPEVWAGWDASMRGAAPLPGVVKYWDERRAYFDDSFRAYFEEHMKQAVDSPSLEAR
jgi:hypothetical protein